MKGREFLRKRRKSGVAKRVGCVLMAALGGSFSMNVYAAQVSEVVQQDVDTVEEAEFEINEDGVLERYCGKGGDVVVPEGITSIDSSAFRSRSSSLTSIEIPEGVMSIGEGAFNGCSSLTNIVVNEKNLYYTAENGILYNKEKTILYAYPSAAGDVIISEGVTSIGERAFRGCNNLTSIKLPEGAKSIGDDTFSGCSSLSNIELPEGLTRLG